MAVRVKNRKKPIKRSNLSAEIRRKIKEQGVAKTANFEHLYGACADLWESDEEFEQFMQFLAQSRKDSK
jgi:hypothetical protein